MNPERQKSEEQSSAASPEDAAQNVEDVRGETEETMEDLLDGVQRWPMDGSGNVWIGPAESNPYDDNGNSPMIGSSE